MHAPEQYPSTVGLPPGEPATEENGRSERNGFAAYFTRLLKPLVAGAVALFTVLACGSIVISKKSVPQYSPRAPIKVGDVIFYYLPIGVIKVDGVYDATKGWTIAITPDIHADDRDRYELSVNTRYPFFDHNAILATDDKGLLKTVYGSSTDRTVEAVGSLIAAAGQVLQFGASLGGINKMAHAAEASPTPGPTPFHITLDPFSSNPRRRATNAGGFDIRVSDPSTITRASAEDEAVSNNGSYSGIMTRLIAPFTVTVTPGAGEAVETTVLLPDRRQRYLLPVPRGPLVTSETTVDFDKGSMVSRNIKRPSVAYAILGIPKTILSALVPIPAAVRQAEITRIQSQSSLIKETAVLEQLRNPSPTPTSTPKPTPTPTTGTSPADKPD
jgi:hypothetical protein